MKTDFDLYKHRKNNGKAIRNAALAGGKKAAGKHAYIAAAVLLAVFLIFFLLNDRFFKIDGIPTFDEIFSGSGFKPSADIAEGNISVHFIDVGQGDCQLILSDSGTVLIDCGEREYSNRVISYIRSLNISRLDYVIASHPHSDHIGGMSYILDEFDIGTVIMPDIQKSVIPTTNTYARLLKSVSDNDIKVEYARAGSKYKIGGAVMTVLSPVKDYEDLNNYSVAVKIVHGQNSFLFTGDIEKEAEADILNDGADVSASVLKVAHHGSSTSSHKGFLDAVSPVYGVIGVGTGNDYGHPHKETIKRFNNIGIRIYRTDHNGSIIFTSDGKDLDIKTEKEV